MIHNKRCEFATSKRCQCSCKGELHGKGNKKAEPLEKEEEGNTAFPIKSRMMLP